LREHLGVPLTFYLVENEALDEGRKGYEARFLGRVTRRFLFFQQVPAVIELSQHVSESDCLRLSVRNFDWRFFVEIRGVKQFFSGSCLLLCCQNGGFDAFQLPLFLVIERLRVQWFGHAIHLVLSYRLLKHRVVSLLGHNRVNLLLLVIIAATAALG
jgi:hypothetical protein